MRFLEARCLLVVFLNFVTVFYNSLQFNNRILQLITVFYNFVTVFVTVFRTPVQIRNWLKTVEILVLYDVLRVVALVGRPYILHLNIITESITIIWNVTV